MNNNINLTEINEYVERLNEWPMLTGGERGKFRLISEKNGQLILSCPGLIPRISTSEDDMLEYVKLLWGLMKRGLLAF